MKSPPSQAAVEPPRAVEITINPEDPEALATAATAFAAVAGRATRLVLQADDETREFTGQVPRRAHWPSPGDPCLMLRPGTTDRTHVLAAMAIHLRVVDGCLALARRRHYEEETLDLQRLPAGPVRLRLEPLP
jgi:hypothetical protein